MAFAELLPFIGFELNRNYIITEVCVDKDVVNSCCQGSCYLKKKVKEAHENQDHSTSLVSELFSDYLPKEPVRDSSNRTLTIDEHNEKVQIHQEFNLLNGTAVKMLKPPKA